MAAKPGKALVKRSNDTELMPPPKRIKRPSTVLDEDTYTDALSHIISRDFFPGLLETETQQEYLDALESKDGAWISSASQRLKTIMTPGRAHGRRGTSLATPLRATETPKSYRGDIPMSVISTGSQASTALQSTVQVDTSLSLDQFQAKYTSEDNESFNKLLDKQNQKRAEKYAWMCKGNKIASNRQIAQRNVENKLIESRGSLKDDGFERKRLAIQDKTEKPAMPDSWRSKPDNNFMFEPTGVEDSVQTVAQRSELESRAGPKAVVHGNTRLPDPDLPKEAEVPPSPSLSALQDAIAGRRRAYSESVAGDNGSETPRVNGYAFVDDEPEPAELESVSAGYGLIDLGKGDATPNPFKIKEQSRREDLHHRMVDKTAKSKRASLKNGMTGKADMSPVPKFPSSPRVSSGNLTPAAQRLWSSIGTPRKGQSPNFSFTASGSTKPRESGLRKQWSVRSK